VLFQNILGRAGQIRRRQEAKSPMPAWMVGLPDQPGNCRLQQYCTIASRSAALPCSYGTQTGIVPIRHVPRPRPGSPTSSGVHAVSHLTRQGSFCHLLFGGCRRWAHAGQPHPPAGHIPTKMVKF
jgi:hypothetical protein